MAELVPVGHRTRSHVFCYGTHCGRCGFSAAVAFFFVDTPRNVDGVSLSLTFFVVLHSSRSALRSFSVVADPQVFRALASHTSFLRADRMLVSFDVLRSRVRPHPSCAARCTVRHLRLSCVRMCCDAARYVLFNAKSVESRRRR